MTGPDSDTEDTKQISVAELLARNGTIGAPAVTRRRRRRRGDDSVTVAELTGEIPIIRDDRPAPTPPPAPVAAAARPPVAPPAEPVVDEPEAEDSLDTDADTDDPQEATGLPLSA